MKKAISLVLAAVLALCMAGGAAADSIHLRYAELDVGENLLTVDAHYFADRVNELSGGRIIIDIYDSAQLGPEKEAVQPMLNILCLPYIFVSREHCWKVLDSDIGDMLRAYPQAQKTGMVGLWFAEEGTRSLITVDGPVTRIDQIAGRKIRANNASLMIDTINAMGASAVPMAYTEVPVSLMSGTIEGLENIASGYNVSTYYETAAYYALTRHITSVILVVMNENSWNRLSPEDQEILRRASADTEQYARQKAQEYEERSLEELKQKNVKINEVDNIDEWIEAVKPVQLKYGAGYEELIARIDAMR